MNDLGLKFEGELLDTLTFAKLYDSDRLYKGGYSLAVLSKQLVGHDIDEFDSALKPYLNKNKDYGKIPLDILAKYGNEDVLAARSLFEWLECAAHSDYADLRKTEIGVTRVLADTEQRGLSINVNECQTLLHKVLEDLMDLEKTFHDTLGYLASPASAKDCYDVLCNFYGLPVLKWTNEEDERRPRNPSFDEDALERYLKVEGKHHEIVRLILLHRHRTNLRSLFLEPYLALNVNGILHCDYNQSIRSGRMSCKRPNIQQANTIARMLIHPRPGNSFVCRDFSQIEYRLIIHYIQNEAAITAYNSDASTDYHQWVANKCGYSAQNRKDYQLYGGLWGWSQDNCQHFTEAGYSR